MDHQFRNGIMIHLPDTPVSVEAWNNVKMAMDIIIGTPAKEVDLFSIYDKTWPPLKARPKAKSRKSYHRTKKK